jgi:hypothetical protein
LWTRWGAFLGRLSIGGPAVTGIGQRRRLSGQARNVKIGNTPSEGCRTFTPRKAEASTLSVAGDRSFAFEPAADLVNLIPLLLETFSRDLSCSYSQAFRARSVAV